MSRLIRVHGGALRGIAYEPKRQRKFLNKPTFYDSPTIGPYTFDSKWEAELCAMLDIMVKAKEITTFINQASIPLPATTESGKRHMMRVDFMLIALSGVAHWWDAKGDKPTPKWVLQKNLAFKHHGIDVIAVHKKKGLPPIPA